jgi:hypothetical protein
MKDSLNFILFRAVLLVVFASSLVTSVSAQTDSIKYEVESQTIGTTNDKVPFWMRSNQFGSVPLSGLSQSFIGRAHKDFLPADENGERKLVDWAFGFEGRANLGKGSNVQLIEAYAKLRVGVFNVSAGRTRNVMGLNGDTSLSSGNFSVSGNAPGIPNVEISIPEYYRIPVFNGLFSFKGNFMHGWVGQEKVNYPGRPSSVSDTYFHQKSLYVRVGAKDWKLNLYGGLNHQVYWGNEKDTYGEGWGLSPFETFYYVAVGKKNDANGIMSKIGNQLGSIDLGVDYNFDNIKVMLYRQNFYDVGALSKLANIADGLNGITFENKNFNSSTSLFRWRKILAEFVYSKDQAGYPFSKATQSGDEDYYNNYYYPNGWTYNNNAIGSPLMTLNSDARPGQAAISEAFINNRVAAYHLGMEGALSDWFFTTKMTYSNNSGTFGTSKFGHSTGIIRDPLTKNIFEDVNQFSFYLESMKQMDNGLSAGFATAFDSGRLLEESYGLILKIKKSF